MQFLTAASGPPIEDIPSAGWIFERIEEWSHRLPDQFAFIIDNEAEFKYADVLKQASGFAHDLAARGIQPGDRVGILMETSPQWVFVLLGAMRMGAVTVPLATTLPQIQLENIVEHSGCRVIFADEPNWDKACKAARRFGAEPLRPISTGSPLTSNHSLNGDATVLLIYTSGTTGDPKGVELTMFNLIYEVRGISEPFEVAPGHRFLAVLPFSHVLPLVANALGPLSLGAGVVFLSSVSPQRIVEAFNRHRITFFVCVPQFFYLLHKRIFAQVKAQPWIARHAFRLLRTAARLTNNPEIRRKLFSRIHRTTGPDLRFFASGGSRFDPGIATDLSELGYTMLNAYGLTETSAAVTATPVHHNRIGSVGRPVRGVDVRIDSPNPDGIGEVCIKGPLLMKGYYRDPAYTAENVRDGWLYTGDLGFIDLDGNLTITGRSKDVIVLSNGKNIYPEEIETHYGRSSFIQEICILGLDEKLHAIVVPDMDEFRRRGKSTILETIRFELETFGKDLPSYQHVLSLAIRNEPLPRTVTRKLKRFEIQAEEELRRQKAESRPLVEDHPRFQSGVGAIVASQVRKAKPDVPSLNPESNVELDLGFDSLSRVELLTEVEARLGIHVDDEVAARIYTLGDLLDAVEKQKGVASASPQGWSEILAPAAAGEAELHDILKRKPISNALLILISRAVRLIGLVFFKLRVRGLDHLPKSGPFMICPNHESFFDAPFLYAVLPPRVIANAFGLGYSDYWKGTFSRRVAAFCNIVAVDSNANLVRAMQIAALGLRHGKITVIFPEGTRSIDGNLTEFKKGAAILACELGVPIVPVGINGTFEAWPRGGRIKFKPIEVVFGTPLDPRSFKDAPDPYAALSSELHDKVNALCNFMPVRVVGRNNG